MRVRRGHARQRQPAAGLGRGDPVQRPARRGRRVVAAGDGDRLRAGATQRGSQRGHIAPGSAPAGQPRGLAPVGRDEGRARQQQFAVGGQCRVVGKGGAGAGAQHRVHHQGHGHTLAQPVHPARHHGDVGRAAQQAGLDGGGRQVVRQRGQLRIEQLRRHRLDARHRARVLRRDGRHHRAQVRAEGLGRALVGHQPGAAATVVAGDAPDRALLHTVSHSTAMT